MKNPIIIMNFSGAYEWENFYKNNKFKLVNLKNVRGTNCYCDDLALAELKNRIRDYPADGIHYIDSGNYHYVTKLWADKIKEPFSLVLFDHHTDMQPPAFGTVLSCGSWVKELLDICPNLKKVYLIGIGEKYIFPVKNMYKERLVWFPEKDILNNKALHWFQKTYIKESLYISVDKDLLSTDVVTTNWDQGDVSLTMFQNLIHVILSYHKVIGMDVAGECTNMSDQENIKKIYEKHSIVNEMLLREYLQSEYTEEIDYDIKNKVRR